jgi:hypothetical protein
MMSVIGQTYSLEGSAKRLGMDVPAEVLVRTDEVIE